MVKERFNGIIDALNKKEIYEEFKGNPVKLIVDKLEELRLEKPGATGMAQWVVNSSCAVSDSFAKLSPFVCRSNLNRPNLAEISILGLLNSLFPEHGTIVAIFDNSGLNLQRFEYRGADFGKKLRGETKDYCYLDDKQ